MSATVIKCVAVAVVLHLLVVVSVTSSSRRMVKELLNTDDNEFIRCKQTSRKSCCGGNNVMKRLFDKNSEEVNSCVKEVSEMFKNVPVPTVKQDLFSIDAMTIFKKKQFCLHECIGKKTKMLNEDGSLNQSALEEHMKTVMFKESWQQNIGMQALSKCMTQDYIPWPANEVTQICNPVYVQFQHCVWLQYEANCPIEHRKSSEKCNKLREQYRMETFLY